MSLQAVSHPEGLYSNEDNSHHKKGTTEQQKVVALRGETGFKAIEAINTPKESEQTIAIGDLHGNFEAFIKTLIKANCITLNKNREINVTQLGKNSSIIITGDILDRGAKSIKILNFVDQLRKQGLKIDLIMGDHEGLAIQALSAPSIREKDQRFYDLIDLSFTMEDPEEFIKAILQQGKEFQEQYILDALGFVSWFVRGGKETLSEISKSFPQNDNQLEFNDKSLLETSQILFFGKNIVGKNGQVKHIKGRYEDVIKSFKPFTIEKNTLFIHGGLDDFWCEVINKVGLEGANEFLQQMIEEGALNEILNDPRVNAPFWQRRNEIVITNDIKETLLKNKIYAIVRGHDRIQSGIPESDEVEGISIFNNDTCLNQINNYGGLIIDKARNVSMVNLATNGKKQQISKIINPDMDHSDVRTVYQEKANKLHRDSGVYKISDIENEEVTELTDDDILESIPLSKTA